MLHADVSVVIAAPLSCLSRVLFHPSCFRISFFFNLDDYRTTKIKLGSRIGEGKGKKGKKKIYGSLRPIPPLPDSYTFSIQSSSIFHIRSNP